MNSHGLGGGHTTSVNASSGEIADIVTLPRHFRTLVASPSHADLAVYVDAASGQSTSAPGTIGTTFGHNA